MRPRTSIIGCSCKTGLSRVHTRQINRMPGAVFLLTTTSSGLSIFCSAKTRSKNTINSSDFWCPSRESNLNSSTHGSTKSKPWSKCRTTSYSAKRCSFDSICSSWSITFTHTFKLMSLKLSGSSFRQVSKRALTSRRSVKCTISICSPLSNRAS